MRRPAPTPSCPLALPTPRAVPGMVFNYHPLPGWPVSVLSPFHAWTNNGGKILSSSCWLAESNPDGSGPFSDFARRFCIHGAQALCA